LDANFAQYFVDGEAALKVLLWVEYNLRERGLGWGSSRRFASGVFKFMFHNDYFCRSEPKCCWEELLVVVVLVDVLFAGRVEGRKGCTRER